ncbi:hypothetical protein L0P47_24220, partial [Bacteroides intestinalis]
YGCPDLDLIPNILNIIFVIMLNIHTTGVKINMITFIGFETNIAIFSELLAAIVFGVISPKIKTNIVIKAVATATPCV